MPIDMDIKNAIRDIDIDKEINFLNKETVGEGHHVSVENIRNGYLRLTCGSLSSRQVIPVDSMKDIVIDGAKNLIRCRVYHPAESSSVPTVIYFHGGGFVSGDLNSHDNICREICRAAQVVVVSVDYRLAPEHPFPAAIEDAIIATRWVFDNRKKLGNNDIIAVSGDSAGGTIAAVLTQHFCNSYVKISAQMLLYPFVDISTDYPSCKKYAKGYFLGLDAILWFTEQYAGKSPSKTDSRLSPIKRKTLKGLPPAIVVTAEYDPLRDSGKAYAEALERSGVKVRYILGEGMVHGFFDMGSRSPAAQAIIVNVMQIFHEILDDASSEYY